jgi:ATP-binding cassette subfamily E protein 1
MKKNNKNTSDKNIKVAIINPDKCKPKDCEQQCRKVCPVNGIGKICVTATKKMKQATISEDLCIGTSCNICVKACPFGAVQIIQLPTNLSTNIIYRYNTNSFKLHKLPTPRESQVLGIVGTNGIGKSTAIKILSGDIIPNFGKFDSIPNWNDVINYYRGSELQNYFTKLANKELKPIVKPQYVELLTKTLKGPINNILDSKNERPETFDFIIDTLDLRTLYIDQRDINALSGGELQRFAIAITCLQKANVYIFDEPSSFLDVKQRLNAALCIRSLSKPGAYVICVEHDLAMLDYLSDFVCCLYGRPSVYGVVTQPHSVREGINIFLSGYIRSENMRFRPTELTMKVSTNIEEENLVQIHTNRRKTFHYPNMTKTMGNFKLNVQGGSFNQSEITVLLGQNGTGKTSFIKLLAGNEKFKPDNEEQTCNKFNISYKRQQINLKGNETVRDMFFRKIKNSFLDPAFNSSVIKQMDIDTILDQPVDSLSGGEQQRVAIILCLGKAADVYLIDEPSAYLDAEQRITIAKIIKKFIINNKKTAFIVEHDFIMACYLADQVVFYDGIPSIECTANSPQTLLDGMNQFLKQLNITFRRDPTNWRPRINKLGSIKDSEQKSHGTYFFIGDE